jgi:hypothetical protein
VKPYKIFKNFLSEQECSNLDKWILDNKDNFFFKDAGMNGKRVTTRYSENIPFPKNVFFIKEKLINKLQLPEVKHPPFCEGMVASYASVGDTLYIHKDPTWEDGLKTLHCNVVLSDSEGGFPIIENEILKIKKGDMWCYLVSDVYHGCSVITGNIPRTMWVFGFLIKKDVYDRLQ